MKNFLKQKHVDRYKSYHMLTLSSRHILILKFIFQSLADCRPADVHYINGIKIGNAYKDMQETVPFSELL